MLAPSPTMKRRRELPEHRMRNIQMDMVAEAYDKHGSGITSCKKDADGWEGSFTMYERWLFFWYNTPDTSTHIIKREIDN